MATTYRMDDQTVVKPSNATQSWAEATRWNGHNNIGVSSGSEWRDCQLYRSRKGRYYVVTESRIEGEQDHAEWVSNAEAARWLLLNDHELPEELAGLEQEVSE